MASKQIYERDLLLLGEACIGLVSPHTNVQSLRLERVRKCVALGLTSLTFDTFTTIVSAVSLCPALLVSAMLVLRILPL
jgi:hypothetical protein